jgi:hypothetical protein
MIRYLTEMPDAGMLMSMALVPMPTLVIDVSVPRRYDMNGIFQMQGGKNWFLPK